MNVIVPARSTPLGEVTFVNLTPTVHDAPGARGTPVQVFDPAHEKIVFAIPPAYAMLVNRLLMVGGSVESRPSCSWLRHGPFGAPGVVHSEPTAEPQ